MNERGHYGNAWMGQQLSAPPVISPATYNPPAHEESIFALFKNPLFFVPAIGGALLGAAIGGEKHRLAGTVVGGLVGTAAPFALFANFAG